MTALVLILSGFSGLLCEVVWARWFATAFGGTVPAAAAVLCTFIGGLASGSAILGRRADAVKRPGLFLAAIQAIVGLLIFSSLLIPHFLNWRGHVSGGAGSFLSAAITIGPISFMMGGTYPVAVCCWQRRRAGFLAARSGWLRGANMFGSVAGALCAAFLLIPLMGMKYSICLAAACSLLAAPLALLAGWGQQLKRKEIIPGQCSARFSKKTFSRLAVFLLALSGLTTICCQLAQLRALAFLSSGTVVSFALISAVSLAGLGGGAWLGAGLTGNPQKLEAASGLLRGAVLLLLAVAGICFSIWIFGCISLETHIVVSAIIVCLPTAIPIGAAFPVLLGVLAAGGDSVKCGTIVGKSGAALEIGSLLGPLLAGLLLLPVFGTAWTLAISGMLLCLGAGGVLLYLSSGWRSKVSGSLAGLACVFALAMSANGFDLYSRTVRRMGVGSKLNSEVKMLAQHEGLESVVLVLSSYVPQEGREVVSLYIGKRMQADDSEPWVRIEKQMGLLPALLCRFPKGRSFHVGLGSGVTAAWSAAGASGRKVIVAEIVPGVVEELKHFAPHNLAGKYDLLLGDGRSLLARDPGLFELIVTDIVYPEDAGAGGLFSREYFRLAREKLRDGGLFFHWLPLWQLSPASRRAVLAAFLEVFPEASAWAVSLDAARPLVGLAGIKGQAGDSFSPERISRAFSAISLKDAQLKAGGLPDAQALLARYLFGSETIRKMAGSASPATDDLPLTEFQESLAEEVPWSTSNLEAFAESARGSAPRFSEAVNSLRLARIRLSEANLRVVRNGAVQGLEALRQAYDANPGDREAAYALWSLLSQIGCQLVAEGQLPPGKGLLEEALKIGPTRDFILKALERSGQ
jgi:spermidine synthase